MKIQNKTGAVLKAQDFKLNGKGFQSIGEAIVIKPDQIGLTEENFVSETIICRLGKDQLSPDNRLGIKPGLQRCVWSNDRTAGVAVWFENEEFKGYSSLAPLWK